MEDGVVTEDGVYVQNRVVVGHNQEVDLVLSLLQLMVVDNVMVLPLRTEPVVVLLNVAVRPLNINHYVLISLFQMEFQNGLVVIQPVNTNHMSVVNIL